MQILSDESKQGQWKEAHQRNILNEGFVEVSMSLADPDSLEAAQPRDNGAIYISNSSGLTDGVDINPSPYSTLEQNIWCLNGTRKSLPESGYGDNGFVSDVLSDDTCVFNPKFPIITIEFGGTFDKRIPGITITWSSAYNEYADTFEIIAYNGETIVAHREVTGNKSVKSILLFDIYGYDRIVILVKKWCLPNHRARVEEIFIGMRKVYGKSALFDYSHRQSVDPVSTSLPKFEVKFSIDNVDGEYNPYNTEGLAKYLMTRQEVKARYGLKFDDGSIEWIDGGTFYLSEWYAKQNGMTADFTARDALEFMSATYTDDEYIVKYDEIQTQGRTLYSLAQKVLEKADLPYPSDGSPRWIIHDSLKVITTKAHLPNDTLANCLQLIANAGECVIYPDRKGTLHIEPLSDETDTSNDTDYKINAFNSYSKSEITLSKPIKALILKVHNYVIVDEIIGDTTTDYSVNLASSAGETITIDNPLVTDNERAESLGQWLGKHLGHRVTLDSSWRADVRLDALDIVSNENSYNTNRVRMTDVEFKFNGAFRGTGKGKVI